MELFSKETIQRLRGVRNHFDSSLTHLPYLTHFSPTLHPTSHPSLTHLSPISEPTLIHLYPSLVNFLTHLSPIPHPPLTHPSPFSNHCSPISHPSISQPQFMPIAHGFGLNLTKICGLYVSEVSIQEQLL